MAAGQRLLTNAGIVGGLLLFLFMGYLNPFFTLYVSALGGTSADIGFLVMLRGAAAIAISLPAGYLIDRTGVFQVLSIGMIGMIAALLLMVVVNPSYWILGLSQIFYGISTTILVTGFQVLVAGGDRDTRNRSIKRYAMWVAAGTMVGPLLGTLILGASSDPLTGYRNAFSFSAIWSALGLVALILLGRNQRKPEPLHTTSSEGPWSQLISGSRLLLDIRAVQAGLIITFIIMFIQGLYFSFVPLYFQHSGYSSQWIGFSLAAYGFAGMTVRVMIPWLTRLLGLMPLLLLAGAISSLCILIMPLSATSPLTGLALMLVMGAAVGLNLPISIMLMVDWVKGPDHGKLMGWRLLVNRTAQMLSPLMFGLVAQAFGLVSAFLFSGVLLLIAMAAFYIIIRRTDKETQHVL
ncbi:MFS transporter [Natronospirillum operosum]|nr:MFS transporter [Natronospirillum operosum]